MNNIFIFSQYFFIERNEIDNKIIISENEMYSFVSVN